MGSLRTLVSDENWAAVESTLDQHPEMAAKVHPTNGEMLLHLICCHPKVWSLLVDMVLVLLSAKKSAASGPFEPPPSSSDVKPKRATRSLAVAAVAAADEAATSSSFLWGIADSDPVVLRVILRAVAAGVFQRCPGPGNHGFKNDIGDGNASGSTSGRLGSSKLIGNGDADADLKGTMMTTTTTTKTPEKEMIVEATSREISASAVASKHLDDVVVARATMLCDRVYGQSRGAAQQCDQRREFSIASELAPNPLLLMDSGVPTRIRKDVPECKAGSLASRQLGSGANSPSKKPLVNESCLPRLLDVLGKGTGHDVVHGVHWSDRSMQVADQLRSMSTSTHSSSSHPPSASRESYPNYDPNLVVTLSGRDFEKFAAVFDQLGSGLNRRIFRKGNGANSLTPTSEDDVSLRALPYHGSKAERRQLRKHFGSLGMMWNSLWLIVIALFSLPAIRGQQCAGQSMQCGPWTTCADIGFPGYCCSQWGVSSLN